jgi:hypothetical protein
MLQPFVFKSVIGGSTDVPSHEALPVRRGEGEAAIGRRHETAADLVQRRACRARNGGVAIQGGRLVNARRGVMTGQTTAYDDGVDVPLERRNGRRTGARRVGAGRRAPRAPRHNHQAHRQGATGLEKWASHCPSQGQRRRFAAPRCRASQCPGTTRHRGRFPLR